MPDFIGNNHDLFIKRILREGRPKILRKYRLVTGKAKSGYIFPMKLFANYFFGVSNDYCFSALLVKVQTNSFYIMIEKCGKVAGIDEKLTKTIFKDTKLDERKRQDLLSKTNIGLLMPGFFSLVNRIEDYEQQENKRYT